MRIFPSSGRGIAVLLFAGSMALAACGADRDTSTTSQGASAEQALSGADDDGDEDASGGSDDDACSEIRARLRKDAMAMQRTKEFKAVVKTQEFKALRKDLEALQKAGCSLSQNAPSSFECTKLKLQAYRHQQELARTPQFKALAKTKEYKVVEKDAREAMDNNCLDDGLMVNPITEADDVAAPMWLMMD